ncbi:hypothetical protein C4K22_3175 [Pseudomonas chlororaphis subsp. aurantiaca]|uniref:hypothetical protein n=1 Tax=Pseudomonas chlororaphis TaxID=587753 RepID=UPI000F6D43BD|nr:hypothetical protein [Pseudomonas chlororaphis]AZD35918.1 hypothetical protein C4K22_3175 [Pseudomonas chlororaphis subsp. aurantiaca]AZD42255.1 hypothetical protein C4K21_3181 [Pseudomonas chlororaphis subsp. aurantiaca]AZD60937.1 hypothetical protein C4K18_2964 [Pseudomonas chlororaphis subsp. aurantiaca]AZD79642.1 hypothetical protein C4K15_3075 [Pseudomonas chlororaphis subsp. aurantiaca]AZD99026.1 hypothetical protein C4K12_3160 [Pseudomonas chlororaphis subsp. aureofaciens]
MTHASAGQASPLAQTFDTSSHFPVISPGLPANSNVLVASPAHGAAAWRIRPFTRVS